jgi:predicted GNAT family N-acyltransferase
MEHDVRIIRVEYDHKEQIDLVFSIRRKVFVDEQGVNPNLEYDEHELTACHYLVLIGEKPAGAARWRETPEGIKLERFAVLPEFRNRGIGKSLLDRVLKDVIPNKKNIYLHSQLKAVPLYERAGFVKRGEIFYEAGMAHYQMYYTG